ncbi:MAG: hypothetical protein BGO98_12810 [Myxococcales bacterium 68-20]|nr:hypothetical protein [Myxococcales bacterium]OJY17035.1 MAG: hypothetical protein BGO98_12810 [Myxococcales bacterium 68-20]
MKSSKLMRVVLGMAAITGTLVLAQDARGGDAPTFSELPVGRITTPPSKKVYSVSAQESVPGFFLVSPPHNSTLPPLQRRLSITTDARLAAALKSGNGFSPSEHITSGCLSQMQLSPFEDGEKEREWDENQSLDADAYPKNADNPMSGVVAIHSERIVEQDGAVTLESVDAWVDPATRGARLISKASLPLKLVRAPAFGMKVYAGRDERPDGRRFVQFVIVRPQTSQTARTTQMWSMRQDGAMAHASGCGHLRVALPIGGDGDTATIITTVELPTLDANGKEVKAAPRPATPPPPTLGKPLAKIRPVPFRKRSFADDADSAKESELRTRILHIQVSVSQTAREKEPLVSASSSWGGREQVERVLERDAAL